MRVQGWNEDWGQGLRVRGKYDGSGTRLRAKTKDVVLIEGGNREWTLPIWGPARHDCGVRHGVRVGGARVPNVFLLVSGNVPDMYMRYTPKSARYNVQCDAPLAPTRALDVKQRCST